MFLYILYFIKLNNNLVNEQTIIIKLARFKNKINLYLRHETSV
jgi:hypothetical protein